MENNKDIDPRIFNIIIGRLFKRVYFSFDEKSRKNMEKIFASKKDKEKEEFIAKHIPNFKQIFEEEAKIVGEEIKAEIEKQVLGSS